MRRSDRSRRAVVVTALSVLALLGLVLTGPVAAAEGAGYGGTADELSVHWVSGGAQALAATAGDVRLQLDGFGFRAGSDVAVRIGAGAETTTRADDTGTIQLVIAPATGDGAEPGTSAIALGVTPSGSDHTLLGTVPPLPSGTSVLSVVVWVAVAGLVLLLAGPRLRRSLRRSHTA